MRICFFGTYDRERPRNKVVINALKRLGVSVEECFFNLWGDVRDKSQVGKLRLVSILSMRRVVSFFFLVVKFFSRPRPDAIIVGYLGHFDIWLAYILKSFFRIPLIFLMHLSIYDTAVADRQLVKKGSFLSTILFFIDWQALRLADLVIVDTKQDLNYFSELFQVDPKKFHVVSIGTDEEIFHPAKLAQYKEKVLFYGQFIPLQGVEYIIDAAEILSGREGQRFIMVGSGQTKIRVKQLAEEKGLKNITWIGWVEHNKLTSLIAEVDIVLGVFGITGKSERVIPNKVYEALACGKPLVTGDTAAVRELLEHGKSAYLCKPGNGRALADSILYLLEHKQIMADISKGGYEVFKNLCSFEKIGKAILDCINRR